jgi:hypothetical protein
MNRFVVEWQDLEWDEDDGISKFNPYHDELGRFTSGSGSTGSYGDEREVFYGSAELQKNKLKSSEANVLDNYTRGGYVFINQHLRENTDDGDRRFDVKNMDSVFEKTAVSCKRDMYLYRGMTLAVKKKDSAESWVAKLEVGDTITDKGFASCSSDKVDARTFASSGYSMGVIFTIKVPKGNKVMAGSERESELIVNRGSKMKVVGIREIKIDYSGYMSVDTSPSFEVDLELM